jgi:hypothetical protein
LEHEILQQNAVTTGLTRGSLSASVESKKEYKHSIANYVFFTGLPFFEVGDAIRMVAETNRLDVVSIKVIVEDDEEHGKNATILIQVRYSWSLCHR